MAHKKFPTWKHLLLSCGCRIPVGSRVSPEAIEKCARCRVKVTAVAEPLLPAIPAPVIVPEDGAQMRLDL